MASVSFALPPYNKEWEESVEVRGEAPASPMRHTPVDNHELVYEMDSYHKRVLKENRVMLIRNIIWTPDLLRQLKQSHVLTQSMTEDIQKCSTREEKSKALLEFLPMRGLKAFDKFCDILLTSGHQLLADSLRDDEAACQYNSNTHVTGIELRDLYRIVPFLERSIGEEQKRALEDLTQGKIKEQITKNVWKSDVGKEKEKALEWRQKTLDQQWSFEEILRDKEKEKEELQHVIKRLKGQVDTQAMEIKQHMRNEAELKEKHRKEMHHQIKANDAEGRTINRLQNVVSTDNQLIQSVCARLRERMQTDYTMNDRHDEVFYLSNNFDKFLLQIDEQEELCRQLSSEKEYVMGMCGLSNKPLTFDLRDHLKSLLVSKEEKMYSLEKEIGSLRARINRSLSLNGRDSSPDGYQLQIAELKVELAKKDEVIRTLTKEKGLPNGDTSKPLRTSDPDLRGKSPRTLGKLKHAPSPGSNSPPTDIESPWKPPTNVHSRYLEPLKKTTRRGSQPANPQQKADVPTKPSVVALGFVGGSEMKDMGKYHHL